MYRHRRRPTTQVILTGVCGDKSSIRPRKGKLSWLRTRPVRQTNSLIVGSGCSAARRLLRGVLTNGGVEPPELASATFGHLSCWAQPKIGSGLRWLASSASSPRPYVTLSIWTTRLLIARHGARESEGQKLISSQRGAKSTASTSTLWFNSSIREDASQEPPGCGATASNDQAVGLSDRAVS